METIDEKRKLHLLSRDVLSHECQWFDDNFYYNLVNFNFECVARKCNFSNDCTWKILSKWTKRSRATKMACSCWKEFSLEITNARKGDNKANWMQLKGVYMFCQKQIGRKNFAQNSNETSEINSVCEEGDDYCEKEFIKNIEVNKMKKFVEDYWHERYSKFSWNEWDKLLKYKLLKYASLFTKRIK